MEITAGEARTRRWQHVMAWVIGISLVFRVVMQAYPPLEGMYSYVLALPYAGFAALTLSEPSVRRQRGFRLMLLCLLGAVLSSFFHTYEAYEIPGLTPYFLMMLFAFCMCYPLSFVLPEKAAARAYAAIAAAFCAAVTVLSGIGVYAAVQKSSIPSLAGAGYPVAGVSGNRLSLFAYPTISAVFCGLALLLLTYLFLKKQNAFVRVLCALAGLVVFIATALTDGRTASVFSCVCFGGVAYLLASERLPVPKKALRTVLALILAGVVFAGSYAGMRLGVRAVNALSDAIVPQPAAAADAAPAPVPAETEDAPTLPQAAPAASDPVAAAADDAAAADATDEPDAAAVTKPDPKQAKTRSVFENLSTLQGRTYAWQGAINAMKANPRMLLFGASPLLVMEAVNPYIPANNEATLFVHLHSIWFQTLIAFGLPGLVLFAAVMFYILFHAVRLFFMGGGVCTVAERSLSLLILFCFCVDLLEIFLTFNDVTKLSNPLFFLTAGYVVYLSTTRISKKAA